MPRPSGRSGYGSGWRTVPSTVTSVPWARLGWSMTNRTLPALCGSLLLAVLVLLLVEAPTVSRQPSRPSSAQTFMAVHISQSPQPTITFIDEPHTPRSLATRPPEVAPRPSVSQMKPKTDTVPNNGVDKANGRSVKGSYSGSVFGRASYYCCTRRYSSGAMVGAACSKLRDAMGPSWRGQVVTVTRGSQQVTIKLVDWCGSKDKLIDLHPGAFKELGPLERGVLRVTVRW